MLGATNVVVAAAALGARERGQRVDGGAGARVRVEADTSLRADGAPQASELPAADRPAPRSTLASSRVSAPDRDPSRGLRLLRAC